MGIQTENEASFAAVPLEEVNATSDVQQVDVVEEANESVLYPFGRKKQAASWGGAGIGSLVVLTVVLILLTSVVGAAFISLNWVPLVYLGVIVPVVVYTLLPFRSSDATIDGVCGHLVAGLAVAAIAGGIGLAIFFVVLIIIGFVSISNYRPALYDHHILMMIFHTLLIFFSAALSATIISSSVTISAKSLVTKSKWMFNRNTAFIYGSAMGVGFALGPACVFVFSALMINTPSEAAPLYIAGFLSSFAVSVACFTFAMTSLSKSRFPGNRSESSIKRSNTATVGITCGILITLFVFFSGAPYTIFDVNDSETMKIVVAPLIAGSTIGVFGIISILYWAWLGLRCRNEANSTNCPVIIEENAAV